METPTTTDEFRTLPTIASQLPLIFSDRDRWNTFTGHCNKCGTSLNDEAVRGHVTRPFGATFILDAWGLCPCGTITPFHYRLPPSMTMVGRSPKNGAWAIWAPQDSKGPWWRRVLNFIGLRTNLDA